MPRYSQPYRGDGYSSVPKRVPLDKSQQSAMNKFGAVVLGVSVLLILLAVITQNKLIIASAVVGIPFLLLGYLAIRDAMGIKISTPKPVKKINKNDPSVLDDYLAQIEWKRTHHENHPKEPEWKFQPKLIKSFNIEFRWVFTLLAFTILPILLVYFLNINSIFTVIGAFILGLAGFLAYLIYQDSRD